MIEWTTSARAELERYFARVRPSLQISGADTVEVENDLKRHIDEEAVAARLKAVTEDDVRRILARIGTPELPSDGKPVAGPNEVKCPPGRVERQNRVALLVFGVVLPLITLGVESATHMCAGAFFDPIPTWWHMLLVGLVPLANYFVWRAVRERNPEQRNRLAWARSEERRVGKECRSRWSPYH